MSQIVQTFKMKSNSDLFRIRVINSGLRGVTCMWRCGVLCVFFIKFNAASGQVGGGLTALMKPGCARTLLRDHSQAFMRYE